MVPPTIWLEPNSAPDLIWSRYLDVIRHGLLIIHASGRVVIMTNPAERLLNNMKFEQTANLSSRQLLRALCTGASQSQQEIFEALRGARDLQTSASFEVAGQDHTLQVEIRSVAGESWVATLEDVSARKANEARADELARLDPLTGLPNRLLLRERLAEALARLQRNEEACALLLIDLDRFKPVNDTLGHPIGDALLAKVADRLRSTVRPTDTVARIGGDEFIILQTGIRGAADAQALARRLVDLIGRTYMVEGHLLTIGASVGVALAPADGTSADKLLKNADLALYRAKLDGRGTYRFFEPEMDARMQARRRLELDMRQALARREFQLHYQPQLQLDDDRLIGCEALIRWKHPERGMISPLDFIPLAEEIGLIVPIGEWVIRQACRDAMTWPTGMSVAVNVSPAQFKSDRLVETIISALASSGLSAKRLEVEITEGVLLQESERTLQTLHRLRELGVRVSMDDFGTGYSSLSYLRSFPFDKIKIDRSFVKDLSGKPDGDAIIRAIAGLGKSLGMTTVAEGVETPEQMQRIRDEGCTDVQGYLISRPIPADDLLQFIASYQP
ncbi:MULTISPECIES: EAL domain-containing protein [unclassified Methylobacterium]|uniref:putative bifunctional diguanylate cyclase/phosphodiesterase n=2 Tax=Methylobacterium TaxID=407 RepID=UPI0011C1E8FD|nr:MULTISPECIES: EAL domain-containing protein [unclassified Methylobacterium]QEE42973.1 EAL domain-containing protein [Methylobacterium sp. WL1]TXN55424.1 EAL domain-containing protein [Methylobacterium sp. WL2]